MDSKIYQQIESAADYHDPLVYEQLSYYSNLEINLDPLNSEFIPVSQTDYRFQEKTGTGLIFAVGLLPPTANVTGRLLDRSATIANMTGSSQETISAASTSEYLAEQTRSTTVLPNGKNGAYPAYPPNKKKGVLGPNFWDRYVEMCNRLGIDPQQLAAVIQTESGFDPANRNPKGGATGLNQITPSTAKGLMSAEEWAGYGDLTGEQQLYYVEKYYGRANVRGKSGGYLYRVTFGGCNNPDGSLYSTGANAVAWNEANGKDPNDLSNWEKIRPLSFQEDAVKKNAFGDKTKGVYEKDLQVYVDKNAAAHKGEIDAAKARVGDSKGQPPQRPSASGGNTDAWATNGSASAKKSRKEKDKTKDMDLNKSELGKKFLAAQMEAIRATQDALDVMRNTPPLRMLINPSSFSYSAEKIISDEFSRCGTIVSHGGDGQDKIEGSGKIAGFYAVDGAGSRWGSGGPGLTRTARAYSKSYQNFMSLWLLYRNNGGVWLGDGISNDTFLSLVGSVYVYYDSTLYIGSFDSFNITETETAPFTLEYSFTFTVRAWYTLDRIGDPRFTYGSNALFGQQKTTLPTRTESSDEAAFQSWLNDQILTDQKNRQAELAAASKNDPLVIAGVIPGIPTTSPESAKAASDMAKALANRKK